MKHPMFLLHFFGFGKQLVKKYRDLTKKKYLNLHRDRIIPQ